jgi:hypothetical protein
MFTTQTKTAVITNVTTSGGVITYHTNSGDGNDFAVGDIVHISGISPVNFNIPDAVISTRTNIQFTVVSTETGTYGSGGLAVYDELKNHLISSSVIRTQTAAIAEWNMNSASNIEEVGNYRFRPTEAVYGLKETFVKEDGESRTFSVFGAEKSGSHVIYTISNPHSIQAGDTVVISGVNVSLDGVFLNSSLSGAFPVDSVTETTIKVLGIAPATGLTISVSSSATASSYYYYGATYADVIVDGGTEDDGTPYFYSNENQKQRLLFSLEECLGKFRPRSGINKAMLTGSAQIQSPFMSQRPRYYFATKEDNFKYWTSRRKEYSPNIVATASTERGIAKVGKAIDDAVPFVVYTEPVAANRIVVKMQTNVGTYEETTITPADPFYGDSNKTTPVVWKIQNLVGTTWESLIEFDAASERSDGSAIVKEDGYLELEYGVVIPSGYQTTFYHAGDYAIASDLPVVSVHGYAYLVGAGTSSAGQYYIWNDNKDGGAGYDSPYDAEYGWAIHEEGINRFTPFVTKMVDPDYFDEGQITYREFAMIGGIRLVVSEMNKVGASFDLIEMSPRLAVDLSSKLVDFSVKKYASDLGTSGLPVGQLLASSGTMNIFDYDQAFNPNYTFDAEAGIGSIINGAITKNLQVKFYEIIKDVSDSDYYIPIKTLYAEGFPESDAKNRSISINLRDQFIQLESIIAQEIFFKDVSLSFAVANLLDSIGFSNYVFKRTDANEDPDIPFFFVQPNTSVAEILQSLAISFQFTMFFDEYNNLVIMSKEYLMPTESVRETDFVVYGSRDTTTSSTAGELYVKENSKKLSSILEVASQVSDIYNDGKIEYSARSIQRDMSQLKQAYAVDSGRIWVYKPVLLWEAPNEPAKQSINEQNKQTSGYALTAIPLQSDLTSDLPEVVEGEVINNTIDLGEGAFWIPRYSGYFYANGEIIKYDAIEYSIVSTTDGVEQISNVWIRDVTEYKNYFSKLQFAGKIYPSGRARIYSKLNENGMVAVHGRGQFGTEVTAHSSGIDEYWTSSSNRSGFVMKSEYLFTTKDVTVPATSSSGIAGAGASYANRTFARERTKVSGTKKNILITMIPDETDANKPPKFRGSTGGSVQSSALIMTGPTKNQCKSKGIDARDFVSYVSKKLDKQYTHFGTRLRIIGNTSQSSSGEQIVYGGTKYSTDGASAKSVSGGSGGIAIIADTSGTSVNQGYYFEISALSYSGSGTENPVADNVNFYKVKKSAANNDAIPVSLFKTQTSIITDFGQFVGQGRAMAEPTPSVYDIAVEYVVISKTRIKFYLYLNNDLIAIVDDKDALPIMRTVALFSRGSSQVMFENVYALGQNYQNNPDRDISLPTVNPIFSSNNSHTTNTLNKYAISGILQESMLSNVNPQGGAKYGIYYDEFGTIMREAAYFNIKYDKAYPALSAKLAPTVNKDRNYVVSGFTANAYGAEFLVFNATDTVLNLDSSTGNYLRIIGVAFNEESKNTLTVDQYYTKNSDFSNPTFSGTDLRTVDAFNEYIDIKNSRSTYGIKSFSISAEYIQTQDEANALMGWVVSKLSKPRKSVGLSVFGIPYVQLGDIVKVNYVDDDGVGQVSLKDSRYVVYTIEYSRDENGPNTVIYLSEVS